MLFFIGQIFPYLSAGIFLVGMIWRVWIWFRVPVPFQLTLSPAPTTTKGRVLTIGKELLLFRNLWRSDRFLWLWAWLMHVTLGMVIVGHVVGISSLGLQFTPLGITATQSKGLSTILATSTGMLLLAALVMLLYRRIVIWEVKRLSNPIEYFDLLLILAVVISGLYMRVILSEMDLVVIRIYMEGILSFQSSPIPHDWTFIGHFFLANTLLIYIPFSKLVHFVGGVVNQSMMVAAVPVYPSPHKSNPDTTSAKVSLWEGRDLQ